MMNTSEYAVYEAAFNECCKKSFGMTPKQINNLIESNKKLEKEYKKLKSAKIVEIEVPSANLDLYQQFQKLNVVCKECKYQTYCKKSVTLFTGTEIPLTSCSFGANRNLVPKSE